MVHVRVKNVFVGYLEDYPEDEDGDRNPPIIYLAVYKLLSTGD